MSRQARELLLIQMLIKMLMLLVVLTLLVMLMLMVHFVEISKFWNDHGAGDDFLDPSRVEYIDKRSIFDFEATINR